MEIRQAMIMKGVTRPGKFFTNLKGVTIHNTGNPDKGANANAHAHYWFSNYQTLKAGIHYVVDDKEAVCIIPDTEICYHAGTNAGNNGTIGIEICDNSDGNTLSATNRGAELAAYVLKKKGFSKAIWKVNIFQHNDWSGKYCPQDIREGKPYFWPEFVAKVNEYMGTAQSLNDYTWTVTASMLAFRQGDSVVCARVIDKPYLYKGEKVILDAYDTLSKPAYARVKFGSYIGYVLFRYLKKGE